MFTACDYRIRRQSFGFVVVAENGAISKPVYIKRSQICATSKVNTHFDFLMDSTAKFDRADIAKIKEIVKNHFATAKIMDISEKPPIEQVHLMFCEHCELVEDNIRISITDGYCDIDTKCFDGALTALDNGNGCGCVCSN